MKKRSPAALEIAGGINDADDAPNASTGQRQSIPTAPRAELKAKIELQPPTRLKPYEKNPTLHPPDHVAQIVRSIKEFGFTVPILCDEDWLILAGHGRHLAALEMKLARVPVIRRHGLTPEQKIAYVLADNKIARNAEFDWSLIAGELRELDAAGFDLDLTGFQPFEIEPLLQATWTAKDLENIDGEEFAPTHGIVFTGPQFEIVSQAIAKVRATTDDPDVKDGRCVELICADYLAGA